MSTWARFSQRCLLVVLAAAGSLVRGEVVQATPVAMTFKVKIGTSVTEQAVTVMLRPINDCPEEE